MNVDHFVYCRTDVGGEEWRKFDYDAKKIRDTLKGNQIKGYVTLTVDGQRRKFDAANQAELREIVTAVIAERIDKECPSATIVPIPNSSAAIGDGKSYRILDLARAVALKTASRNLVVDALRWATPMVASHLNGSRDVDFLQGSLRLNARPNTPVVLLDDVVTSSAHLRAAARHLNRIGITTPLAIAFVRSTHELHENVFGWQRAALVV